MKKEKKDALLKKYLNKKEQQKRRDDLITELKHYENLEKPVFKLGKKTKNNAKKERYKNISFNIGNKPSYDIIENKNETNNDENIKSTIQMEEVDLTIPLHNIKSNLCEINKSSLKYIRNDDIESIYMNLKKPKVIRNENIENERKKLPIYYEEQNIITRIKQLDVTIIHGTTGCGKSTQIPQFLYENGMCNNKRIALTQPRRLAAINISKRINYELNSDICAYQIRHENTVTKSTAIKVLTEGIMLNEIKNDFLLLDYSIVILDEVHEQTANIEIILSLLKQIQNERHKRNLPFKIILMSATYNINNYMMLFENKTDVINIETNKHEVTCFYEKETCKDFVRAAYEKILSILSDNKYKEIIHNSELGILVFVPGKSEIYKIINLLSNLKLNIVILPLHSSLSIAKQNMIYQKYDIPKIIISTNIAETSLTIPEINIVIDSGLAKYKQYTDENTYSYTVNYISKSSADQRLGRAGRTSDGLCFRLYSSKLYAKFRESEQPEILQIPLDSHILVLKSMGIENIRTLKLYTDIPNKQIQDGYRSLQKYGAIDKQRNITEIGLKMAILPLEARYARMVVTTSINTHYLLLIAAILTYNFEITNQTTTSKYFSNCKSDLIVKVLLLIDYINCENKLDFASSMKFSFNTANEIFKLYQQLCHNTNSLKDFKFVNDIEIEAELHKIIAMTFSDNIALLQDDYYLYNNKKLYISKNSVALNSKYIAFDHIIEGIDKIYAKNITCADILFETINSIGETNEFNKLI